MATQQEVIKAFMKALDDTNLAGEAALDEAVRACSHFKGIRDLIENCTIAAGAGNFLLNYCGIDLYNNNKDTGAITGSDAGGSKVKTAESVVPESGSINKNFDESSFTVNGLTVNLGIIPYDGISVDTPKFLNFNSLSDSIQIYIWQAFKTWWASGAINLITDSYGSNYGFTSASTTKTMYFGFFDTTPDEKDNVILAWTTYLELEKGTNVLAMAVNINQSVYGNLINGGNPDGKTVSDYSYLDRTLAHEMTHAVMMANIVSFASLPQFIKEGMAELTHGIDDDRTKDIKDLSNSAEYLKSLLRLDDNGTANGPVYAAGYILLRYLARQASSYGKYNTYIDNRNDIILNDNANENTDIISNGNYVVINGLDGNDTITANGDYSTIEGGAGDDSIIIYSDNISADGGTGVDTIEVHGSNVTIDGGGSFDYLPVKDTFRIGFDATNIYIKNFESADELIIPPSYYLEELNGSTYIKRSDGTIAVILIDFDGIVYNVPFIPKEYSNKVYNGTDNNDDINLVGDNVTIYAGDGDDFIYVNGENWVIDSGIGKDRIINLKGYPVKILGGEDDDVLVIALDESSSGINNFSARASNFSPFLDGGSGNDSIKNNLVATSIVGGIGNDSIENDGEEVTIDAGVGNDSIYNFGDLTSISGGEDNDTINNNANNVTIDSGSGDDFIYTYGYRNSINGGNGNDTVENRNDFATIDGGAGNDNISNNGTGVSINGGLGDDSIWNDGKNVTIEGGFDDDAISNNGSNVSINARADDDYISNFGSNVTINGGDGNDYINNYGTGVSIDGNEGNDSIYNSYYCTNVTIDAGVGNDSIYNDSDSVTIDGGDGNDSISNSYYSDSVTIDAGAGNDYIVNEGDNVSINAGDGSDTIDNYNCDSVTIISGADSDSISNRRSSNVSIDAGAGNDSISNSYYSDSVTIDGGDGNDSISNSYYSDSVTIDAGAGNDYIVNEGDNVSINAGDGSDTINNYSGDSVTIIGGAGDDEIHNDSDRVSINGSEGTDYIENYGSNVTIDGGAGDDTIRNDDYDKHMLIHGGAGDDSILNRADNATVCGDDGNDYLENLLGEDVTISGGNGKDTIYNRGDNSTIFGGAGDDSVYNEEDSVMVDAGDGDDTIQSAYSKFYVTVDGGNGNDSIVGTISFVYGGAGNDIINGGYIVNGGTGDDVIYSGGGRLFEYSFGDGNDTVYNFYASDTLSVVGGSYSTQASGSDVIVKVGDGSITLKDAKGKLLNIDGTHETNILTGTAEEDVIKSTLDGATIQALDGNDTIQNLGANSVILSGDGDDRITNDRRAAESQYNKATQKYEWTKSFNPDNVSIDGGDGNDSISNGGQNVSINGGAGNDTIYNRFKSQYVYNHETGKNEYAETIDPDNTTIDGGLGDDDISNGGSTVSIDGGLGDDSIWNDGKNVTIEGGFDDDAISNSGENVLFVYKAGDGNDSIYGFNETSTLQIISGTIDKARSDGTNIFLTIGQDTITLQYSARLETLNVIDRDGNQIVLDIKNEILGTDEDDIIHNWDDNVTINAGTGDDDISNSGSNVSINARADDDYISNFGSNVTINGGAGKDTVFNDGASVKIYGGTGDDTVHNSAEYDWDDEKGETSFVGTTDNVTIDGGDDDDYLNNEGGKNVSISGGDGNDYIHNQHAYKYVFNTSKDYWEPSDEIFATPDKATLEGGAGNDTISDDGTNSLIKYATGDGNDIIFGFNETSTLSIIGTTYSTTTSGKNILVTVGNGKITLVGAASLASVNIDGEKAPGTWSFASGKATYKVDGKITITVTGVKSKEGISVNGSVVTISNAALGTAKVSVSNGYTLALGEDVAQPTDITAGWTSDENIYIYTNAGKTSGYEIENGNIVYKAQIGGEQFTLNGIKSLDGVNLSGKTVTLSKDALNGENITLSGNGYKLAIDKSVPTSSTTTKAAWTNDGDTHTYTAAYTPAYYKLSDNKVTYTAAKGGEQFTISGISSTSGIKISGKTVTVGKSVLGNGDVKLVGEDFTLAFDKTVPAVTEIKAGWKNFTYTAAGSTAGYKLDGDKIIYQEQIGGEQFTISGVKSTNGISVNGKVVTLSKSALNGKNVELTGEGYTLALGDDVPTSATKTAGAFTSCLKGTATFKTSSYSNEFYTLSGNTVAYTSTGGGEIKISSLNPKVTSTEDVQNSIKISEVDGSVKITFKSADVLNNKAPTITAPKSVAYTLDVVESLRTAEIALDWTPIKSNGATLKADIGATYNVVNNKVTYTAKKTSVAQVVLGGLTADAQLATPTKNILTLDATDLSAKASLKSNAGGYSVKLTGDMSGKTFVGTSGADTLNIAAENAAIQGGKGNDTFTLERGATLIYGTGDGHDTVNFAEGLVVSLNGSAEVKGVTKNDSDVVLGFGNNSSITVTDIGDGTFAVVGSKQNFTVGMKNFDIADSLTFDKEKSPTAVTVAADFTGAITQADDLFLGGKLSSVTTIDASAVMDEIFIEGNAKANVIYGGQNRTEVAGGKGNDTFVFGGGEIVITDYGNGSDKIDLGYYKISRVTVDENRDLTLSLADGDESGTLTVVNGKDAKISLVEGKTTTAYVFDSDKIFNSGKTAVTLLGSDGDLSGDSKVKTITAGETFSGKEIFGNSAANTIYGNAAGNLIDGGAGNDKLYSGGADTLWGGGGNDSLYGDNGDDTFIYIAGKDVVFNFADNDLLQITGDFSATYNTSKKELAFKVGSTANAITMKNFSATTFNINGSEYIISGTQLVEK